jgi:hypothetical protein
MASALSPGLLVAKNVSIRRIRTLPIPGVLSVRVGDVVHGSDTVGVATLPGELSIARISETMGITPQEVVKGIVVPRGSMVRKGELLCEHRGLFGLFKTRFYAPCDGTLEFITETTGHVGIRGAAQEIARTAYLSGRIVDLVPGVSVTVEAQGACIQGIFGIGGERSGHILPLAVARDAIVRVDDIPQSCAGALLCGGMKPELAALRCAAERGAVGFITGSIDDDALRGYLGYDLGIALTGDEKVPMSVIITEGFGAMPISERIATLLQEFAGYEASLNGATQVRAGALRPEILIPHRTEDVRLPTQDVSRTLVVGTPIRLIRVPYFGVCATVTELPEELVELPTGTKARVLRAQIPSGEIVTVPRANIEVL